MEGCVICSKLEGGHEKVHTKQRVNLITRTDIVTSQVFHVCVGTLDLCRFILCMSLEITEIFGQNYGLHSKRN